MNSLKDNLGYDALKARFSHALNLEDHEACKLLTSEEVLALYEEPAESERAQLIIDTALKVSRKASGNRGQVFAQIGIDARACNAECLQCSFAASNSALKQRDELSIEEVVSYARVFAKAGVHLISLMITMSYTLEEYLEVVKAVRRAVGPQVALLANASDISLGEAQELKAAGADAFYHAVRIGEGKITSLDPQRRIDTIQNVRAAGLSLMTGVEPLYAEQDSTEVVELMVKTMEYGAVCTGVCPLVHVEGSPLSHCTPPTPERRRYLASLYRLLIGTTVPFGIGNTVWVNAGTDPRGRHLYTETEDLIKEVVRLQNQLAADGWLLPEAAPAEWFASTP